MCLKVRHDVQIANQFCVGTIYKLLQFVRIDTSNALELSKSMYFRDSNFIQIMTIFTHELLKNHI